MGQLHDNLLNGYRKFRQKYAEGAYPAMERLAALGQHPKVMIVACCDSRVDPALLLQCHPGDLFVVRNIANIIPPFEDDDRHHGTSAALEYAVCYLGIDDLIILGHSECGGISALLQKENMKQNDFITNWVSVSGMESLSHITTEVDTISKKSLHVSYQNCLTFPWIKDRVETEQLNIHRWFLDIQSGNVFSFNEKLKDFVPLLGLD